MIDWQPIETAPKDGTTVLLWAIPLAGLSARGLLGRWVLGGWQNNYDICADYTHWAPLNPPTASPQEAQNV